MLWVICAWLCIHATLALCLRVAAFRTERGIFAYHLGSFVSSVLISTLVVAASHPSRVWPVCVAAACIHGVYSLSFLELWSLAQGSYSLSIIAAVSGKAAERGVEPDLDRLERIGVEKQSGRVTGLLRLGLVVREGDRLRLTRRGALAAHTLAGLRWWSATRGRPTA